MPRSGRISDSNLLLGADGFWGGDAIFATVQPPHTRISLFGLEL